MTTVDRKYHSLKVSTAIGKATVELDGEDIADCVLGMQLTFRGNDLPTARLDLALFDVTPVDSEQIEVLLDDRCRDLLVRLGWTPPSVP